MTCSYSTSFSKSPKISDDTSVDLLDSFDVEILQVINEAREEKKSDYISLISTLSDTIEVEDLFKRLGKLRALNLIRATQVRVSLLPRGMDYANTPQRAPSGSIPSKYSSRLARARIDLEDGNLNGVTDTVHVLFEDLLRDTLRQKFGDSLEKEWKHLQDQKKVAPDFGRASLGALLRSCAELGVITRDSVYYMWISSFLALRNPQKHSTEPAESDELPETQKPSLSTAKTSLGIAEIFLRHWFG